MGQTTYPSSFLIGVDLGQAADYTAVAVLEQLPGVRVGARLEHSYQVRYLDRPALGTRYPAIVGQVIGLLDRVPLTRQSPLIVDKTGVGAAVVDLFAAAGVRPRAVTITGGTADVETEDRYSLRVPKRELASTLVALYQGKRLKVAESLPLASTLVQELLNFRVKINIATGNDSYESWRESIHDDLVLAVALAAWYGETFPPRPWAGAVTGGERTIIAPPPSKDPRGERLPWDHRPVRPWWDRPVR